MGSSLLPARKFYFFQFCALIKSMSPSAWCLYRAYLQMIHKLPLHSTNYNVALNELNLSTAKIVIKLEAIHKVCSE